jgi:RecJ-like exonuclease
MTEEVFTDEELDRLFVKPCSVCDNGCKDVVKYKFCHSCDGYGNVRTKFAQRLIDYLENHLDFVKRRDNDY